eukprot:6470665-Amphidinium_carterae.2
MSELGCWCMYPTTLAAASLSSPVASRVLRNSVVMLCGGRMNWRTTASYADLMSMKTSDIELLFAKPTAVNCARM